MSTQRAWMGLALAIVLAGPCEADERSLSPVDSALIAIIPTRDGIVLATDNGHSSSEAICNGVGNIVIPTRDLRVAVVFTGTAHVATTTGTSASTCDEIARNKLDLRKVIHGYLDAIQDESAIDLRRLSHLLMQDVSSLQALSQTLTHPSAVERRGTVLLAFAVVSYDPANKSARVGVAALTVGNDDRISPTVVSDQVFSSSSPALLLLFGKTALVQEQVFGGNGSEYLDWEKVDAISQRKVRELGQATVVPALRSIFVAAARVAVETTKTYSTGEIAQFVLVGDGRQPELIDPR